MTERTKADEYESIALQNLKEGLKAHASMPHNSDEAMYCLQIAQINATLAVLEFLKPKKQTYDILADDQVVHSYEVEK